MDAGKLGRSRTRRALVQRVSGTLLAALLVQGCGGTAKPPRAGTTTGFVPDLRGRRVMVFPVQLRGGVAGDVDPEIAFAFRARGSEIDWVFPDELQRARDRAPGVETSVVGLPVGMFLQVEVERVGDPLYGQLRRMGELVNSSLAFIPVMVRPGAEGVGGVSVVEIVSTILDVRTGRVVWFGVIAGAPGEVADFGSVASAVEKLAETLLWYTR